MGLKFIIHCHYNSEDNKLLVFSVLKSNKNDCAALPTICTVLNSIKILKRKLLKLLFAIIFKKITNILA